MNLIKTYKTLNSLGDKVKVRVYYDQNNDVIGFKKLILVDKSKLYFHLIINPNVIKEGENYALIETHDGFKCDTLAMIMNDLIKLRIFKTTEI